MGLKAIDLGVGWAWGTSALWGWGTHEWWEEGWHRRLAAATVELALSKLAGVGGLESASTPFLPTHSPGWERREQLFQSFLPFLETGVD